MKLLLHVDVISSAESFAKAKHAGKFRKDGTTPYSKHLQDVVNRLKSLGVIDSELLCAGWLHDILEDTDVTFDEIYEQFGNKTAVIVTSLTKDTTLPRKQREQAYVKQLRESSHDAKIIKICDISANLSDIKNWNASKSKKLRQIRKLRHYMSVIKNGLIQDTRYPGIISLLESNNQVFRQFGQKSISLNLKNTT